MARKLEHEHDLGALSFGVVIDAAEHRALMNTQEQLGHASISTTLNIHTHLVDASHRKAVEELEERLFGEMDCFGLKSPATVDQPQPASAGVH